MDKKTDKHVYQGNGSPFTTKGDTHEQRTINGDRSNINDGVSYGDGVRLRRKRLLLELG